MSLPERLFDLNKDEKGYGYHYRDENGEMITFSTYEHWYGDKTYLLIWENRADYCKAVPAVYGTIDNDEVHERILDKELTEKIFASFLYEVGRPLQTDGPAQYYEQFRTPFSEMGMGKFATGMMQAGLQPDEWFCTECGHKNKGGKFCPECGTRKQI